MEIKNALQKLDLDLRDYSHHMFFGTLGAASLPTQDFTIYDALTYTIKWGDTLSSISQSFGYTINDILSANPKILNPNRIYVGEVINIPARKNKILDQKDLDFCPGFTAVELQNALWGVFFDPFYQMAKIKQVRGEYKQYGANLRDGAQSVVKYGSLPAVLAPYTHNNDSTSDKTRDFLANWANYPKGLDQKSAKYCDLSFFTLDGVYDAFDNIRSALWMHRSERRGVSFGLEWHPEWTYAPGGIIPDVMPTSKGDGHDMAIIGQKTINGKFYLVHQQSWTEKMGDGGLYYFPRSIIDQAFGLGYGAMMFSRIDKSGSTGSSFLGYITQLFNLIVGAFKK